MKNNALATIAAKALPALSGSSLTYNPDKNVFLTQGYTSAAGNTYYQALRISDRLAVFMEMGDGYAHTFLNGLKLFCWDGKEAKLIGQRHWGGSNWVRFSEQFAKDQSVQMVKDFLEGQLKLQGQRVDERQLLDYSRSLVEETRVKRLA